MRPAPASPVSTEKALPPQPVPSTNGGEPVILAVEVSQTVSEGARGPYGRQRHAQGPGRLRWSRAAHHRSPVSIGKHDRLNAVAEVDPQSLLVHQRDQSRLATGL